MIVVDEYRRLRGRIARIAAVPMLVRFSVLVAGAAALLVALPAEFLDARVVAAVCALALLPAGWPRGAAPTVVAVLAIALYLVATVGYVEPVALWRILALASLLYAAHTLAALAACLPYDAEIRSEAVTGWVIRLLAVVFGSAVVLVAAIVAAGRLTGAGYAAFAVGGLVAAVGAAALLARISR